MNQIDQALGVSAQALSVRSQRLELIARNLANADTPNFKAQDLDFKKVLQQSQNDLSLQTTNAAHIAQADGTGSESGVKYRVPFNVAFDGNTVEMNVEQAQYGKSAADYQATLDFLDQRVQGIRRALKGE
jgi:flagellar basal-body rod protein FlgB